VQLLFILWNCVEISEFVSAYYEEATSFLVEYLIISIIISQRGATVA